MIFKILIEAQIGIAYAVPERLSYWVDLGESVVQVRNVEELEEGDPELVMDSAIQQNLLLSAISSAHFSMLGEQK